MGIDHSPAPSNLSTEQAAMQIDGLLAEDPAYANDQPPEEKGRRESTQRPQQADEEPEVKAEESSEESEETEQPEEESEAEEHHQRPQRIAAMVRQPMRERNQAGAPEQSRGNDGN